MLIRPETPEDFPGIRHLLKQAFDRFEEANLVDALRCRGAVTSSLVAVQNRQVVGHILFSPVTINSEGSSKTAVGLAPLAVLPEFQRQGIGSRLVRSGLSKCQQAGYELVFVLGHPNFYRRFGFQPAWLNNLRFSEDVPQEAFMVEELRQGALIGQTGVVLFQPEFRL